MMSGADAASREAFRSYLERAGVVDALTKVLVSLYEEPDKPKQAVDYIKSCLGGPTQDEHDAALAERDALRAELEAARAEGAALRAKVAALEAGGGEAAGAPAGGGNRFT